MQEIFKKISSYNIFNYLVPGVIFAILAEHFTRFKFIQGGDLNGLIISFFIVYFIGQIISRIGSLFIQNFLEKIKFIKPSNYKNYIKASQADAHIKVLNEAANSYRTYCSLAICFALLKLCEFLIDKCPALQGLTIYGVLLGIFALFLFSYRKQINFINDRIGTAVKRKSKKIIKE